MTREVLHFYADILTEIRFLKKVALGLSLDEYRTNDLVKRAVERSFLTISEAVRKLPAEDLKSRHPEVPWKEIKGFGNVLRHDYFKVTDKIVWETVQVHLRPLEAAVRDMAKPASSKPARKKVRAVKALTSTPAAKKPNI